MLSTKRNGQGSEQGSEFIRVLNMSGFIKKPVHHIDAW